MRSKTTRRVMAMFGRLFVLLPVVCLLLAAGRPGRAAGPAVAQKDVWIVDGRFKMPFCRVRVPEGWLVEGNAAWTYDRPVSMLTLWFRITDTDTNTVHELVAPIGVFRWYGSGLSPDRMENDGKFNANVMMYLLRGRTASELLAHYIIPLVEKTTPGAEVLWLRSDAAVTAMLRKERESFGAAAAAFEDDGAALLVERAGRRSLFVAFSSFLRDDKMNHRDVLAYWWDWTGLVVATAPAGSEPEPDKAKAIFDRCLVNNPEWVRQTGEMMRRQRETYRPGDTWPMVNSEEYDAQAWRSGEMFEAPAPSGTGAAAMQYADRGSDAMKRTAPDGKGYANAVVAALVLGDSPFASGIAKLEPFE